MGSGIKSLIGMRFHTWDVLPTDADAYTFFEYMSESLTEKLPPLKATGLRGVYEEGESHPGPRSIDGDINIEARMLDTPLLLKAMFGVPVSALENGGVAGVFEHIWVPNQEDINTLHSKLPIAIHKYIDVRDSVTIADDSFAQIMYNLNAGGLEFSFANGDFLKTKMSLVGGRRVNLDKDVPTFAVSPRITWDNVSITLGGVTNCDFRDLTLTISDSLEAIHTVCPGNYPSRIQRSGNRTITLGGTLVFRTNAELKEWHNQSERPMIIDIEGAAIGAGDVSNVRLRFDIPALRHMDMEAAVGGPGALELPINMDAKYNVAAGHALQVTVVNEVANYT